MIDSIVNPSPKTDAARITDKGPKKTSANVEIASARYALGLTIKQNPIQFQYKRFVLESRSIISKSN
jgi:hypothetical protein